MGVPQTFARIETESVLPDGRRISTWRSYPEGVGLDEYRLIDRNAVRAFGSDGTRTIGTPLHRD